MRLMKLEEVSEGLEEYVCFRYFKTTAEVDLALVRGHIVVESCATEECCAIEETCTFETYCIRKEINVAAESCMLKIFIINPSLVVTNGRSWSTSCRLQSGSCSVIRNVSLGWSFEVMRLGAEKALVTTQLPVASSLGMDTSLSDVAGRLKKSSY